VITKSQSIEAIAAPLLVPYSMNRVVKSSRRRKEPSAMSRATPASSG
jgi:hypothetical protein